MTFDTILSWWSEMPPPVIIGYLAGVIGVSSFLFAEKKNLLYARVVTDTLFALHYFLIGALAGGYLSLVYVAALFLSLLQDRLKRSAELSLRAVLGCVAAIFVFSTYAGLQDILVLFATWISFYMYGVKSNIRLRLLALLVVTPLWFVYAYIEGSVPAMLTLFAYQIATLFGILRACNLLRKDAAH